MLSVVMLSAGFSPTVGGSEKQALELSRALRARGVDVRVLTRRLPGLAAQEDVQGVPVERLWCAGRGLLNSLTFLGSAGLWLCLRTSRYSVVHAHLAGSPALAAALAGRLLGKRVFIKLGGGRGIGELAASTRTWGGAAKLRLFSWLKPQFVAVTRDLADECAEILGGVPVRVQPNGVDTQRYLPADAERKAALRRKLGWPEGPGFLYVGRFAPEKRLDLFLRAWCRVAGAGFAAFVGEGPEGARLEGLAAQFGPAGRIFVLPPMKEIQEAYAAADVFVLPSVSEGLSNSLLEAMASGLAVLGSRVGGTAEVIAEGVTGLLFRAPDEAELEEKLKLLLTVPGLAARLGAAARAAAVERFSIERVARQYERWYSE